MRKQLMVVVVTLPVLLLLTGQAGSTGNPKLGRLVFEKHCSGCHGRSGGGLGPSTRMPNFSDRRYQESHTAKEVFDKITRGVAGSGMPSWEKTLSQEERWNVTAYVKTLAK